ncbi:M23 family metallopeptidase [Agrobacterium sp. SHOUNA12C]|nr:M23 family metallopeptidase [Agrobacterium sp. BETTINA12B]MCJ9755514.1 M23 family metallopeptidase [Agrobacterium sp. SHOUNA12C]NTG54027.1 M23 family metallopeptidase [Rhizobium rhizogenes]
MKNAKLAGIYPIPSIAMKFHDTTIAIPARNGITIPYRVSLPEIDIEVDASPVRAVVEQKLQSLSGKLPGGIDSTVRTSGTSIENDKIIVLGDINIQKWISMTGFECKWHSEWWGGYPECSATEWKTRVFDKTFPLHVDTQLSGLLVSPPRKPLTDVAVSNRTNFDVSTDVVANSSGLVDWHISNDIERFLYDALTWLGSTISARDFNNWNFEDQMPEFNGNEKVNLDARNLLYPNEKALIYRDRAGLVGKEGYKGLWQIFVDTLQYDPAKSGFRLAESAPFYRIVIAYTQDNLQFGRRISENNDSEVNPISFDPFEYNTFCTKPSTAGAVSSREMISNYMDEIASKLDSVDTAKSFSGNMADLRRKSISLFGTTRAADYALEKGFVKEDNNGIISGRFPLSSELIDDPSVVMPWDTVETIGKYFDITGRRLACFASNVRKKNRSADRLLPYQEFDICGSEVSDEQNYVIDEAARLSSLTTRTEFDGFVEPVKNASYRGWYYCYQNPRICSGRENIYWWQEPSKYNSRGGRHKGIDLYGGNGQGSTNIYAVTSGTLIFSDHDSKGWGNALLIPFQKDNASYFAVYAHLPSSARSLDGRKINKGDAIGITGCTGNAGDGMGNCNSNCLWSGQKRTDEHLHFEIIKKTDAGNEAVDPVAFGNFSILSDGRSFRVACENRSAQLKPR